MICRLAVSDTLSVSSFESFRRMCHAKFEKENKFITEASKASYGCRNCPTGKAIISGNLQTLPENIGLIDYPPKEIHVMPQKSEAVAATLPPNLPQSILDDPNLATMKAMDLRLIWLVPVPHAKKIGHCANCNRKVQICAAGLCGGCYSSSRNKTGLEMLSALAHEAYSLKNKGADARVATSADAGVVQLANDIRGALGWLPGTGPCTTNLPQAVKEIKDQADKLQSWCNIATSILESNLDVDDLVRAARRRMEEIQDLKGQRIALQAEIEALRRVSGPATIDTTQEFSSPGGISAGYESLASVLWEALDQAQHGKGRERHANHQPFLDQPIMVESRSVGLGFPAGQARKKVLEAVRGCGSQPERAIADLLGAINYVAATVLAIREQSNLMSQDRAA